MSYDLVCGGEIQHGRNIRWLQALRQGHAVRKLQFVLGVHMMPKRGFDTLES